MSQIKRFFTTPIYYVNDVPHIGHAYTSIAVDFLARFSRLSGHETRFLTGTDEHGLKIQKAAEKLSMSPLELCNKNSEIFRNLTKTLNLSNDDFIRTTEDRHKDGAVHLWNLLFEKGDIYLDEYTGWYSLNDETFYSEKDLIKQNDGTFRTITGGPVEWIKEESYFFKLSKYQDKLLNYYSENNDFILPESKRNEVINFVKSGLKDLSVSRTSFKWGIQVPDNSDHIMYVWLDALTCYPNSVNYLNNEQGELSSFWSNTTHIVGKDILRHHAVYWPAFLIAANLELPKRIYAHGWWTNEGNKISKSLGNVIDPFDLVKKYGVDQIRYFLMREVPFGNDGDFSHSQLINRINSDLANSFGNLFQRVTSMIFKNCHEVVPIKPDIFKDEDLKLINSIKNSLHDYRNLMDEQKFDQFLKNIWMVISDANKYVDEQAPWSLKKNDYQRMEVVLYTLTETIRQISIMLQPFIPNTSKAILDHIDIPLVERDIKSIELFFSGGIKISTPNPLFPRI